MVVYFPNFPVFVEKRLLVGLAFMTHPICGGFRTSSGVSVSRRSVQCISRVLVSMQDGPILTQQV